MGDRVTIVDVARQSGVAISSASAALNGRPGVSEQTRARVQATARELGYVPSLRGRSLSSKKAFAVGLVVRRSQEALEEDPFFGAFIGGLEQAIARRGNALVLQMARDEEEEERRYNDLVGARRVDGVVLNELRLNDSRIGLINRLGLPAVGINPFDDALDIPSVLQPSAPGVKALVEHLISLGHTRIAYVAGPEEFVHSQERIDAWRDAMKEAGLPVDLRVRGDFTYEGGRRAADRLLSRGGERPTAVACSNDLSAIGLLIRAQELGLAVPEELSVVGYDDIALGRYIRPALTTVRGAPRELGVAAGDLLLDTIEDPEHGTETVVEIPAGAPIYRHSTAPPIS